jgi:hypothetical protein
MAKKLGSNACICRNTGSFGAPAWAPITAARDIKWNLAPGAVFVSNDRFITVNTKIPVRYETSLEFSAIWDGGIALTALRTAFLAGTSIELAFLKEAPTNGAKGIRGEWCVAEFPFQFPLQDGQLINIKLVPHGIFTNAMTFYTDATGALGTVDVFATKKLGNNASVNLAGGTIVTQARDAKFTAKPGGLFDSKDRTVGSFNTYIPTRFEYTAEFEVLWDEAAANLTTLQTAFQANNPQEFWILDGPYLTTGSWGIHSDFAITDFGIDAQLLDGQKIGVKLEVHGNYANAPTIVTRP